MDFVRQKNFRLVQIIKNCRRAQYQFQQLRKSINLQGNQSKIQENKDLNKNKSGTLLKNSRMQIIEFDRKHKKMNSYQQSSNPTTKTQTIHLQNQRQSIHVGPETFNSLQKQHKYEIQEQQKKQQTKQQQLQTYFPYISSAYGQTFKPKNASLSHFSIVQKQLQNSIHSQKYKIQNIKLNNSNFIKSYQSRNEEKEQKLDQYRLNILRQISHQNVKKYLLNRNSNKQKKALILLKQKPLIRSSLFDK